MKIGILGDTILSPDARHDEILLKKLEETDLNIANLEAPFINDSFKHNKKSAGLFQLMNDCAQIKKLNIQVVSLANNHIFDFGEEGLLETIRILKEEKIRYFGAGKNLDCASEFTEINIDGRKVAIGGFVSSYLKPHKATSNRAGTATIEERNITNALKRCEADIKILYNHWNQEYEDYPEPLFLDMSRRLIEHCNCIIGSHPHCIQGIQEENGKLVFHSIGNFTMPHRKYHLKPLGAFPDHCYEAFFVILHVDKDNCISYEKVPYRIVDQGNHIAAMSEEESVAFNMKCLQISKPLSLGYKEYSRFYRKSKNRKIRPILRKSHIRNTVNLWFTSLMLSSIRSTSRLFAQMLDFLGIRQSVRKRFSRILNWLFKI